MRLIDADEPRKLIRDEMREAEELGTHDADVCKASLMMALSYIDTTLTIDAMPVVRCKNCKWSEVYQVDSDFPMERWCDGGFIPKSVQDDDFCSWGERKDNE